MQAWLQGKKTQTENLAQKYPTLGEVEFCCFFLFVLLGERRGEEAHSGRKVYESIRTFDGFSKGCRVKY